MCKLDIWAAFDSPCTWWVRCKVDTGTYNEYFLQKCINKNDICNVFVLFDAGFLYVSDIFLRNFQQFLCILHSTSLDYVSIMIFLLNISNLANFGGRSAGIYSICSLECEFPQKYWSNLSNLGHHHQASTVQHCGLSIPQRSSRIEYL